jgi:hypothetical protein
MFQCPACGKAKINPWRKLTLSAVATWPCSGCDADLSVPWWDFVVAAVCMVPPMFVASPILMEIGGTVAYVVIHQFAVPLVSRNRSGR